MIRRILLTTLLGLLCTGLFAQTTTVTGEVFAADNEKPLSGVTVMIDETTKGTVTDVDGKFSIDVKMEKEPVLVISMLGFEEQRVPLSDTMKDIKVKLREKDVMMNTTVVSASRVEQNIMQAPVTIEKLSLRQLKSTPSQNMYDAVAQMKGVDVIASSLTWKSYNTRGFNSPANSRFVQRLDGVDMQAPGLNLSTGALSGASDLDIQSIEIIPGAASALYGPNAFNGLMNVQTKDAWDYPGLSASVRVGANHLNSGDQNTNPQPMYDFNARYAKPITRRFAVKANIGYMRATDWKATDYRDVGNYAGATNGPGLNSAGYDGLNIYGDEVASTIDSSFYPAETFLLVGALPDSMHIKQNGIPPTRVARTGYKEEDLLDYGVDNLKADMTMSYKFNSDLRLDLTSRFSKGSSVLQADNRMRIKDFLFHNHKAELSGKNFFLRAYATVENAGNSYDSRFTAMNVNRSAKSDTAWFGQYNFAYFGFLDAMNWVYDSGNPFLPSLPSRIPEEMIPEPGNPVAAREFADGDNSYIYNLFLNAADPNLSSQANVWSGTARYKPGTPEYDQALNEVTNSTNWDNGGGKFVDKSQLYNIEGQYDFSDALKFMELIVGGNGRMYRLNSQGIVFGDTAGPINVYEYGAYAQAARGFVDDRVRLTISTRVDKITNFEPRISPRIATVFLLGKNKNHNLRGSFQTGYRMPSMRNQYLNLNLGPYRVIGGFQDVFDYHGLEVENAEGNMVSNAYTTASVNAFRDSGDESDLVKVDMQSIQPEFVRTYEIGYKGFPIKNLMIDVNMYFNQYQDFIGNIDFVGPKRETIGTADQELDVSELADDDSVQYFQRYINFDTPVNTQGISAGFMLFLSKRFSVRGNYAWTNIEVDESREQATTGYRTEFNTPEHKANVGFGAQNLLTNKNLSFNMNYRWIDGFFFEFAFADGPVESRNVVDAQVSYKLPRYKTELTLGGTNLLNERYITAPGGPTIGTMVYFQLTYDQLMN